MSKFRKILFANRSQGIANIANRLQPKRLILFMKKIARPSSVNTINPLESCNLFATSEIIRCME